MRGLCTRCVRRAQVEIVFRPRRPDGSLSDPVAKRFCDHHRPRRSDGPQQVRDLSPRRQAPGAIRAPRRRPFPGHDNAWTTLAVLPERES
jgi:hypothetical protein